MSNRPMLNAGSSGDQSAPSYLSLTPASSTAASVFDLGVFWGVVRWNWRFVAALALAAAVLTVAALALVPAKYKATTVVLVDPRQPRVTATEAVLAGIGADAAAVESQVELLQSTALAERVIAKLELTDDPELTSISMAERVRRLTGFLQPVRSQDADDRRSRLVQAFEKNLSVQRRGLTYILEIGYLSTDPHKARRISMAIAEAYLEDQRAAKAQITSDASGWLTKRMQEIRDRLRTAEQAVADYKAVHRTIDVTQGNKLTARQIEDLTQQLALARSRKAEAFGRLQRVQEAVQGRQDTASLGEALQSPVIASLRVQYADAARTVAEGQVLYGARHPSLIVARAQAEDLRRQIAAEVARLVDGVRNDYQVASTRESSLEQQLSGLKEQAEEREQTDIKLRELEREAQANRTLFEQFLNRAKETTEQQSLQIADARIVSPALAPTRPERPSAILLVLAAALSGGLGGVALTMVREQMRSTLRTPAEVESALGLPSLGCLPEIRGGTYGARPAARHKAASPPHRYATENPTSEYAAALWAVVTRLPHPPRSATQVFAVISALPDEGKTTFASNLALTFAASGLRTLLVDADFASPALTRLHGGTGPGLAEVLQGSAGFASAAVLDKTSGLYFLGALSVGRASPNAALPEPAAVDRLIREQRAHFDVIVVDGPAILPTDGGTFGGYADHAILMTRWDRTDVEAVSQALALLGDNAAKIKGVVLNRVAPRWHRASDTGRYLQMRPLKAPEVFTPMKQAS